MYYHHCKGSNSGPNHTFVQIQKMSPSSRWTCLKISLENWKGVGLQTPSALRRYLYALKKLHKRPNTWHAPLSETAQSHHARCLHLAKLVGNSPSSLTKGERSLCEFVWSKSRVWFSVSQPQKGDFCQQWRPSHLFWLESQSYWIYYFVSRNTCHENQNPL